MGTNQIGDIEAGVLKTYVPTRSDDVHLFPGMPLRWGLAYMINLQPVPDAREPNGLDLGWHFRYVLLDRSLQAHHKV